MNDNSNVSHLFFLYKTFTFLSDLPTILINCINHCKPDNRETALVILRNLCTHSILKSKLLTAS